MLSEALGGVVTIGATGWMQHFKEKFEKVQDGHTRNDPEWEGWVGSLVEQVPSGRWDDTYSESVGAIA